MGRAGHVSSVRAGGVFAASASDALWIDRTSPLCEVGVADAAPGQCMLGRRMVLLFSENGAWLAKCEAIQRRRAGGRAVVIGGLRFKRRRIGGTEDTFPFADRRRFSVVQFPRPVPVRRAESDPAARLRSRRSSQCAGLAVWECGRPLFICCTQPNSFVASSRSIARGILARFFPGLPSCV